MSHTTAFPESVPASCRTEASRADEAEQQVVAKVSRRLLWFIFLLFVFSFLDRINIGFAGLTMTRDLGLTSTQFGLATTLFQSTGQAVPATVMSVTQGVLFVPVLLTARWAMGLTGVVWAMPITEVLCFAVAVALVLARRSQTMPAGEPTTDLVPSTP